MKYGVTIYGSVYIEVEAEDVTEARDRAHESINWGDFEEEHTDPEILDEEN